MELLQLIFSVLAGLGAGALGALYVSRQREVETNQDNAPSQLEDIERRTAEDREQIERLTELWVSDRDFRKRLQRDLLGRDAQAQAFEGRINQLEKNADAGSNRPHQRFESRIDETVARLSVIETGLDRLERRIHSKLVTFREGTQEVLRKLAEHQVEEAERVTHLSKELAALRPRIDSSFQANGGTDAAWASLVEAQTALAMRTSTLEARVEQSLEQLERYLASIESGLGPEVPGAKRKADAKKKKPRRSSTKRKSQGLESLVGIGPKLASQLRKQGVRNLEALAHLREEDIERLNTHIRGFKDRSKRYDWIDQAKAKLQTSESNPSPPAVESAKPSSAPLPEILPNSWPTNGGSVPVVPVDAEQDDADSPVHRAAVPVPTTEDEPEPSGVEDAERPATIVPSARPQSTTPPKWPVPTFEPESAR